MREEDDRKVRLSFMAAIILAGKWAAGEPLQSNYGAAAAAEEAVLIDEKIDELLKKEEGEDEDEEEGEDEDEEEGEDEDEEEEEEEEEKTK